MQNVKEVLDKVDWKLLKDQKQFLMECADKSIPEIWIPWFEGLINFLDALQEAAKKDGYPVVWIE